MVSSRRRRLVTCVALALLLTACTDSGATSERPTRRAAVPTPEWTTIEIGRQALPDEPILRVTGSVDATDDLPAVLVGTSADPGEPPQSVVWHPNEAGSGKPTLLPVDAAQSWPTDISQVGSAAYVSGWIVEAAKVRSFVLSSADRKSWKQVVLPTEAQDRGITILDVIDNGAGKPLAIGAAGRSETVAIDLDSGVVTTLPSPGHGLMTYDVTGAATLRKTLVVLTQAHESDGTDHALVLRSSDAGRTWDLGGELPGRNPVVSGIVATPRGLVATGGHTVGSTQRAVAWSTGDGATWRREPVRGGLDDWGTSLSAPVSTGSDVYAAVVDTSQTGSRLLRRTTQGEWVDHGPGAGDWRYPGTSPVLALDGDTIVVARSDNGRFQVGRHDRKGRTWRFRTSNAVPAIAPASTLEAMWFDAGGPVVVGSREVIEVTDALGFQWDRRHRLAPFQVSSDRMGPGPWNPAGAEDLDDIVTVGTADGREVIVGERKVGDRMTLIGWTSTGDGRWKRVRGLGTKASAEATWLNLAGNGFTLTGNVDGKPAVWASNDGLRWRRVRGALGVRTDPPAIEETCALADGSLLAVGHHEDADGVRGPVAYRRENNRWTKLGLSTLGPGIRFLSACTTTPSGTIVQGTTTADRLWVTTDGKRFEPLEIGALDDHVARIVAVPGGFAAFGQRQDGNRREPTVWLSSDGSGWSPVALPDERFARPDDVMLWGRRLVVTTTGESGPQVYVLENLSELLSAARD